MNTQLDIFHPVYDIHFIDNKKNNENEIISFSFAVKVKTYRYKNKVQNSFIRLNLTIVSGMSPVALGVKVTKLELKIYKHS